METAQTNLGKATMVAPFDGVVTAVTGQVGQVMESTSNSSSKPGVTVAANPDVLQVETTIGQADINFVKLGQKAEITLDTMPNTIIHGTVSSIAVQGTTTQNVTTFAVKVTIDEKNTILKAGMSANVNIVLEEVTNVLTIPSEALKNEKGQNFVLIPDPSKNEAGGTGNTSLVPVEIGLDDGSNVEIKSGLNEGQEIVVSVVSAAPNSNSTSKKPGSSQSQGSDMGALNRATNTRGGGMPSGGGFSGRGASGR
ncbi:efflux RND transporter periplasmic adaptor subunit [Desulfitobacterium sp.]|uniref:efflux RND transporter periplasmic adaptor subunit n=1 Tax=Desulfitobacterium sp. TaxID=49981 RepID=UPI002B210C0B|nr:efflux RND transporter periplasmic adaptor subunit [Desulfitobacterium sp.]MEA4900636.1 efflux RND transporter periplasmic adaptor subunit [Desulfitobacterium sp.]